MKNLLLLILFLQVPLAVLAQETSSDSDGIYEIADEAPEPVGGRQEMLKWIAENLDIGKFQLNDSIDCGKVYVGFIIDSQGKLVEPRIEKGLGEPFDSLSLRVISDLPTTWIPGTKDNKKVMVKMILPISFCNKAINSSKKDKRNNIKKRRK